MESPYVNATLLAAVSDLMREVAEQEVLPRFRALRDDQIQLKGPDDYVTEADQQAELVLTARLRTLVDVPVVGEEATAANPSLPDQLGTVDAAWVVDPVDGTYNFVHGTEQYAMMIALVEHGRATAAWILHPSTGTMVIAALGYGTTIDGVTVPEVPVQGRGVSLLEGRLGTKHVPDDMADAIDARRTRFGAATGTRLCAGWDYYDLLLGNTDFLFYWNTQPWDHAPGSLMARELGYRIGRPDGSDYHPGMPGEGLIIARASEWQAVRDALLSD